MELFQLRKGSRQIRFDVFQSLEDFLGFEGFCPISLNFLLSVFIFLSAILFVSYSGCIVLLLLINFIESLLLRKVQKDVIVEDICNIIDIGNEAAPNCGAVFRRYSEGYKAIKLRSKEIRLFVSAEEFFKHAFLISVEYKLFFTNFPENLVVQEDAQAHSRIYDYRLIKQRLTFQNIKIQARSQVNNNLLGRLIFNLKHLVGSSFGMPDNLIIMAKKKEDSNLLPIAEDYFNTIFAEVTEMKALVLDSQTSGIISVIYTQSKLYKNDVYLIQKIEDVKEKLMHLKGVYFVRPTRENISLIKQEIQTPHFKEYHLFFTNTIDQKFISELAQVDVSDRIKNLQEVYLDYYAVGRNIFSLKIPSTISITRKRQFWNQTDKNLVNRISDGLISLTMSLRVLPQVKFLNQSDACGEIARLVSRKLEDQLMKKPSDYSKDERAYLIITERKEDVVTPLLTPWTYQAMLHQFFGIYNNKIDIKNKQKVFMATEEEKKKRDAQPLSEKQKRQFVLSEIQDDFFRKNAYSGFGELAGNIKAFINDVSLKRNKTVKLESLEDMHDALSKIPELNSLSASVEKHVTLSCEISAQIQKGLIFEVSRIQQDVICQDNRKQNIEAIWKILKNQKVEYYLKLKLVLLFSIKYPNDKQIKEFLSCLQTINNDKSLLSLVNLIQLYQQGRKSDLFHTKNLKKKALSYFDRILKDVPNVYTQHKPFLLENVLPDILQQKVKETDYRTTFGGRQSGSNRNKPLVIVFYVGGVTYTEAKEAEENQEAKIVVGGTFIHNSKTFISEVIQLQTQSSNNSL